MQRVRHFLRHRAPRHDALELRELSRTAAAIVAPSAEAANVRLEVHAGPVDARFTGDAVLLRQVLVNLLYNAIHAASIGDEHRVTLTATIDPERVRLRVTDTGPRLSEAQRARLFEPFHSTRPEGMGLGLVLSRSIVRAHGGRLQVEFPPSGNGLTMMVELARLPPSAE